LRKDNNAKELLKRVKVSLVLNLKYCIHSFGCHTYTLNLILVCRLTESTSNWPIKDFRLMPCSLRLKEWCSFGSVKCGRVFLFRMSRFIICSCILFTRKIDIKCWFSNFKILMSKKYYSVPTSNANFYQSFFIIIMSPTYTIKTTTLLLVMCLWSY